jgi:hypothetical protein
MNVLQKVVMESNPFLHNTSNLVEDLKHGRMRAVIQPERFIPPVSTEIARLQDRQNISDVTGKSRDTTGDTETQRSLNRIKSRLPKTPLNPQFNRQSLPPMTDVLGREKKDANPLYPFVPKPVKTDKVAQEIGRFGTPITRSLANKEEKETPTQLRKRQIKEGQSMEDYLLRGIDAPGYAGNESESLKSLSREGRSATKEAALQTDEKTANAKLVVRAVEAEKRAQAILDTHTELTREQKAEVINKLRALFGRSKTERTKNLGLPMKLAAEADITSQLYSDEGLLKATVEQFIIEAKSFKP